MRWPLVPTPASAIAHGIFSAAWITEHAFAEATCISMAPRLRVAIVGAGVSGLVLAVALQSDPSLEIAVYEGRAAVEDIGAGIGCFGKSVQVIRALGLEEDLAAIATCHPRDFQRLTFRVRKADEVPGWDFATRQFGRGQTFHRTQFLKMFRDRLGPNVTIHLGKRVGSYADIDGDGVTLNFADGTAATCDVLVGCDGIHSAVRRTMFTEAGLYTVIDPVWSGNLVYRSLFPLSMLRDVHGEHHPLEDGPVAYCGANKNIIAYPVNQGKMVNLVVYATSDPSTRGSKWFERMWVADAPAELVLQQFSGWERDVQSILKCAADLKMTRWAVHEVKPLPFFSQGRVVLAGDGAHAMQSHSGSGANQSIEDAYLLGQLLRRPDVNAQNVGRVLAVYDQLRRPYAQRVAESSAEAGEMLQLLGKYSNLSRDGLRAMGHRLATYDEWHKDGDLDADIVEAMKLADEALSSDTIS